MREYYWQCEDCDSTYPYDPIDCLFCGGNDLTQLEHENYSKLPGDLELDDHGRYVLYDGGS